VRDRFVKSERKHNGLGVHNRVDKCNLESDGRLHAAFAGTRSLLRLAQFMADRQHEPE